MATAAVWPCASGYKGRLGLFEIFWKGPKETIHPTPFGVLNIDAFHSLAWAIAAWLYEKLAASSTFAVSLFVSW